MRTRQRRAAAIFGLLVAIFVVRLFVNAPGLSIVFLAAFPIVLAAFALGRVWAVAAGLLISVRSIVVPLIGPGSVHISTSAQILGGVFPTVV